MLHTATPNIFAMNSRQFFSVFFLCSTKFIASLKSVRVVRNNERHEMARARGKKTLKRSARTFALFKILNEFTIFDCSSGNLRVLFGGTDKILVQTGTTQQNRRF